MLQRQINQNKPINKLALVLVILFFVAISFFGGFYMGVWQTIQNDSSIPVLNIIQEASEQVSKDSFNSGLFWDIWEAVATRYVDRPVDDKTIFYGAIKGMVSSLNDPYSEFLDPAETEVFTRELSGSFEGIGAEIGIKNEQLTVIAPLPDSPAEKAGLKSGDEIFKIDDTDTIGMRLDEAVNLIRGKKGTVVTLTVMSRDEQEVRQVHVERDEIQIDSVTWEMIDNDIALIKLVHFDEDTGSEFSKIAAEILLDNPRGIILDLRSNPGGYLQSSVDVAGEFVEEDVIVVEDFGETEKDYKSSGSARLKGFPTVVLVNGGSASASEIVAGAFQDYSIATIVGVQTFGKGTVQDFEEFSNGSSLKLTVAKWLTPLGRLIEGEGIQPDIEVSLSQEEYDDGTDPQLESAIQVILEQ